jgi:phosphoribosyl 1,2-cyclic phosphate phosphodiesterase
MADRLRLTITGCGSSPGTPRINGDWAPATRRIRRTAAAAPPPSSSALPLTGR